jgi:hypothetical protein
MRAWLLKKKADEASSRGKGSTGASSSESEGQEAALEDALVAFRDGDVASDSFSDEEQSWDSASRDGLKEGSDRERVGVASSACGQCNGSTIGSHEGSAKEGDHETEPPSFSKVCAIQGRSTNFEARLCLVLIGIRKCLLLQLEFSSALLCWIS